MINPRTSFLLTFAAVLMCCSATAASLPLEVSISPELSVPRADGTTLTMNITDKSGAALTMTITNKSSKPVEFYTLSTILEATSADRWVVRPPSIIVTGSGMFFTTKLAPGESIRTKESLSDYFDKVAPGPAQVKFHIRIPLEHRRRPVEMERSVRFVLTPAMARMTNRAINR